MKTKPNKANRRALPGNPKHEALNPKQRRLAEHDLKKQSQFAEGKMSLTSIMTKDYGDNYVLGVRKNKAKQSQFDERLNDGLSFLPRIRVRDKLQQESRFLDRPGFRIKCGMTGPDAHFVENDLKKQSQFPDA